MNPESVQLFAAWMFNRLSCSGDDAHPVDRRQIERAKFLWERPAAKFGLIFRVPESERNRVAGLYQG